jgi:hypothetical protein
MRVAPIKAKGIFFNPAVSATNTASSPAAIDTVLAVTAFAEDLGFETRIMGKSRSDGWLAKYYVELASSFLKADVFLALYPPFCPPLVSNLLRLPDWALVKILRRLRKHRGTILYITDLPIDQALSFGRVRNFDSLSYRIEKGIFESFDVLCVFNQSMIRVIHGRYGIPKEKFVEYEILEHRPVYTPPAERDFRTNEWIVAYAGSYDFHVGDWAKDLLISPRVRYAFTGRNWDWLVHLDRPDILVKGLLGGLELLRYLGGHAHFGLIQTSDSRRTEYYNLGSTSRFGTYIASGLPILVSSSFEYVRSLVLKYGVGLSYDRLEEIPNILEKLSESDYRKMRDHSLRLAQDTRNGRFFKNAVSMSIRKMTTS